MDLNLYLRVLWRFRLLVLVGLLLAFALSFLSVVRVSFDGGSPSFTYRQAEIWQSSSLLLVTERGFPWGRTQPGVEVVPANPKIDPEGFVPRFADSGRFRDLAFIYAGFATSDEVRRRILRDGPLNGRIDAAPFSPDGRTFLPIVMLEGISDSPEGAMSLATRTASALREYIAREQEANKVAPRERVVLADLKKPNEAELVAGRKKTRPVAIFLAALIGVLGLAFVLENLRPRVRAVPSEVVRPAPPESDAERRSA